MLTLKKFIIRLVVIAVLLAGISLSLIYYQIHRSFSNGPIDYFPSPD